MDSNDNVYVAGANSNNVFKITADGVISEIIDSSGAGAGNGLVGIAVEGTGNVYVTGAGSDTAFKIMAPTNNDAPESTNTPIVEATVDEFYGYTITTTTTDNDGEDGVITAPTLPTWLMFTGNGDGTAVLTATPNNADVGDHPVSLVVADQPGDKSIQDFTITVNSIDTVNGGLLEITEIINGIEFLDRPNGIAVDSVGNFYVTGAESQNAFKITPDGVGTEIIDATGDGAGNILWNANAIAVDSTETST